MQIASFLPHYQLVCISFDISSFSLISYIANAMLLPPNYIAFILPTQSSYNKKKNELQHTSLKNTK